jgi:hypothetical protein
VILRPLGPGLSFAYVPWGPELPEEFSAGAAGAGAAEAVGTGEAGEAKRQQALEALAAALKPLLPPHTAFIRFDPPWHTQGAGDAPPALDRPFLRAAADVQPPDTVILDLAPEPEAILGAMKPKWRYNIGLAEKKGVAISREDQGGLDTFYALLEETARRDGIAVHHIAYYRALFDHARNYPGAGQEIRLYAARHEGDALGAIVTLFRGKDAVYLYGASSGHKRNLMAPYALQWKAISDARAAGCLFYDFFGIPPNEDPRHPMAGLYRFKTGFGGRIIHRPGSWDYVYKPLFYRLFRTAEGLRKSLRDRGKKIPRT